MERYRVLLDYHNMEADCVSYAGLCDMYAPLIDEWDDNLLFVLELLLRQHAYLHYLT